MTELAAFTVLDSLIQPKQVEIFVVGKHHRVVMPPAESAAERRGIAMLLGDMLIGFAFDVVPQSFNSFFSNAG